MATIQSINRNITRELTALENRLKAQLIRFFNKNLKPRIQQQEPTELLRQKYESAIIVMLRTIIQDSYLKGTDLVGKQIRVQTPDFTLFVSGTDIDNIQQITTKLNDQFWKTVNRLVVRENSYILTPEKQLEKRNPYDNQAAMVGTAALVVYNAFNNAVRSKLDQLTNNGVLIFKTAGDSDVDPKICKIWENVRSDEDPSVPTPPLHRHCRCRLIPVVEDI